MSQLANREINWPQNLSSWQSDLGLTLTITHKERSEPLYIATDSRQTGGIIEISQFNLTDLDRETVIGCAEYLEEQQQKQLEQERQLGEELEP